jgi:hypothetical protein
MLTNIFNLSKCHGKTSPHFGNKIHLPRTCDTNEMSNSYLWLIATAFCSVDTRPVFQRKEERIFCGKVFGARWLNVENDWARGPTVRLTEQASNLLEVIQVNKCWNCWWHAESPAGKHLSMIIRLQRRGWARWARCPPSQVSLPCLAARARSARQTAYVTSIKGYARSGIHARTAGEKNNVVAQHLAKFLICRIAVSNYLIRVHVTRQDVTTSTRTLFLSICSCHATSKIGFVVVDFQFWRKNIGTGSKFDSVDFRTRRIDTAFDSGTCLCAQQE